MSHFQALLYLRRSVGEDVGIATGRRAVDVAGMSKETGCAPEQFDSTAFLFRLEHFHHCVEIPIRLLERCAFGSDITIVKCVEGRAEFFNKFKRGPCAVLGILHALAAVIPRTDRRSDPKRVGESVAEGMP